MRKILVLSLLLALALNAFGHAGEVHKYMGTVSMVHEDGSFMLDTTHGTTVHVAVAASTRYVHADGSTANASDLAAGKRVVATISRDGKTASEIKLAAAKKN